MRRPWTYLRRQRLRRVEGLGHLCLGGRVVRRVAAGQNGTENHRKFCPRGIPKNASCKKYVFWHLFVSNLGPKMGPKTCSKSSPAMRLGCLRPWFVWTSCGRRSPKVPMQAALADLHQNPVFCDGFRAVELSLRRRSQRKRSDNHDSENHHKRNQHYSEIHANRTSNDARKQG